MRILDLLLQMRMTRTHMALVVDEYGGIDGLITIEDLVEQIVGEIEDEHDIPEGPQHEDGAGGTLIALARATIQELADRVGPVPAPGEPTGESPPLGAVMIRAG